MKIVKNLAVFIIFLFFVGCGGGNGSKDSLGATEGSESRNIEMVVGKTYNISRGDTIVNSSTDTIVSIETDITNEETVAVLKKGKATILSAK